MTQQQNASEGTERKSQTKKVIDLLLGYHPTELDHTQQDRAQLLRYGLSAEAIFTRQSGRPSSFPVEVEEASEKYNSPLQVTWTSWPNV